MQVGISHSPGTLAFAFRVAGDLTRVRVPPPSAPRIAHQLWEHTCFEVFVAVAGEPAYREFNFAPSGEWAGYDFSGYREVVGLADDTLAPGIAVRTSPDRLELDALVHLDRLSLTRGRAPLQLGLSAVIEAIDGTLSYWALHHPDGKPDFHHADARSLRLEPPAAEW
ncbi:MAG: DOMON-like domain-containing protein [Deltaproteobacteria bacterium]|nr:DOMON-like domain-containing protein [Deltaproteobacteria bacterium]MBI3388192.1 DOMON-like domain-containing protein [Deltaproteobacteria bacterium]